jgi:hypothetical protein
MAGMDGNREPLIQFCAGGAMASLAVALLMLRDTKRRFSLIWLFAFTTFVAIFFGLLSTMFRGLYQ